MTAVLRGYNNNNNKNDKIKIKILYIHYICFSSIKNNKKLENNMRRGINGSSNGFCFVIRNELSPAAACTANSCGFCESTSRSLEDVCFFVYYYYFFFSVSPPINGASLVWLNYFDNGFNYLLFLPYSSFSGRFFTTFTTLKTFARDLLFFKKI